MLVVVQQTWLQLLNSLQELLGLSARVWEPMMSRDGLGTVVVVSGLFTGLRGVCCPLVVSRDEPGRQRRRTLDLSGP